MQGLPTAALILVIPCLLCQKIGLFSITKVFRYIRENKVDFYIQFTPSLPEPTIETTMTLNYWATNRTIIPFEGAFVEPRQNQIKGLLTSSIYRKGMAQVSFSKTDFLDFANGYMGLPYQPIALIGFPNRQYFLVRFRVDFEWKVAPNAKTTKAENALNNKGITFPRGDQLYFKTSSVDPYLPINNIMEFLIPKDFEKTADVINSSRIHLSLFFVNSCDDITAGYFQVKYKNLARFFEGTRRKSDKGWGEMIEYAIDHEHVTVRSEETTVSLPIRHACDDDWSTDFKFPQGLISFRRRAVFSNRNNIIDELSSKSILTFGYSGNPYGYPNDYGFLWEESTDSNNFKICTHFGDSCVITCKFVGPNIVNVTIGEHTPEDDYYPIYTETRRTFEQMKMSIRLGLGTNKSNRSYYCQMSYGYPEPTFEETITFKVIF